MTGLNKAYELEEERPWWRLLSLAFGLTFSLSVLGLVGLATILYGHRAMDIIGQHLGAPAQFDFLWRIHWAVIVLLLLLSLAVLYRFGPNLKISGGNGVRPARLSRSRYGSPPHCCFGYTRSTPVRPK